MSIIHCCFSTCVSLINYDDFKAHFNADFYQQWNDRKPECFWAVYACWKRALTRKRLHGSDRCNWRPCRYSKLLNIQNIFWVIYYNVSRSKIICRLTLWVASMPYRWSLSIQHRRRRSTIPTNWLFFMRFSAKSFENRSHRQYLLLFIAVKNLQNVSCHLK